MHKRIISVLFVLIVLLNKTKAQSIVVDLKPAGDIISRFIYGQFAEHLGRCVYDGLWDTSTAGTNAKGTIRMDVVNALKKLNVPVLRWPGGCFADQYHWRDGIGPVEQRPKTINNPWGKIVEDNSFGTDEFMKLCSLLNCEPYMAGNMGSGTPAEMQEWIEYLNYPGNSDLALLRKKNGNADPYQVQFWGVGNESWGCGGEMTPSFYADMYKKYASYCYDYGNRPLKKVISGNNVQWTDTLLTKIRHSSFWGMSIHYYAIAENWTTKGSSVNFNEQGYYNALSSALGLESFLNEHEQHMNKLDPENKVALVVDEWGIWTDPLPGTNPDFLYQQNTMRDALIAASSLNIFNNHCNRVKMANLAQIVNVLQALILTDKDKMLLTPTYYVFDMYKAHQDAKLLPLQFTSPVYEYNNKQLKAVNASASIDSNGITHLTFVNIHSKNKYGVDVNIGNTKNKTVSAKILTAPAFTDMNTFEDPLKVKEADFKNYTLKDGKLHIDLPAMSVLVLAVK